MQPGEKSPAMLAGAEHTCGVPSRRLQLAGRPQPVCASVCNARRRTLMRRFSPVPRAAALALLPPSPRPGNCFDYQLPLGGAPGYVRPQAGESRQPWKIDVLALAGRVQQRACCS